MNLPKKMTLFEQKVIEFILKKEGLEFSSHQPYIEVSKRENTVVGMYVDFEYSEEPPIYLPVVKTIGTSVHAEIKGLEYGAGFALYIDDGKISLLECFCYGEEWPHHIEDFELRDLS